MFLSTIVVCAVSSSAVMGGALAPTAPLSVSDVALLNSATAMGVGYGESPHKVSFITGVTVGDNSGLRLGAEYEYRLTEIWGVGATVDYTFADENAFALTGGPWLHLFDGDFSAYAGLGIQTADGDTNALLRLGAYYDFHVKGTALGPAVTYDVTDGEDMLSLGLRVRWGM